MEGERLIFDLSGKAHFSRILWFLRNLHGLYTLGPNKCYMIALLYDKIWNYVTLLYLVSTQKTEANFKT